MARKGLKINQLKAGAVLSYISMGLGYLVSIIYTPIMLRLLGHSEYVLYNLVASVVAYLGILNFGFGSAYMRYYSRYKIQEDREKIASLNGMFLIIFSFIIFSASIIFLTYIFKQNLPDSKIYMPVNNCLVHYMLVYHYYLIHCK